MKNHIREYRGKYNVTQAELAAAVGVVRQTIAKIERGKAPALDIACRISRFFGKPVDALFDTSTIEQKTYIDLEKMKWKENR